MAAIFVRNLNIIVTRITELSNTHVACASLKWRGQLYVASIYCQSGHEIRPYLPYMDRILGRLPGKQKFLGMDANAKSVV